MKNLLFIFCMLCMFLLACFANNNIRFTEDDVKTVDISNADLEEISIEKCFKIDLNGAVTNSNFNPSEFVDTMFFLPLQTSDASVCYDPSRIYFGENRIIIEDYKSNFVVFDKQGQFINAISKGNGPGEISKIGCSTFDEKSQKLIILQNKHLTYFDCDGRFTNRMTKCPLNTAEFAITDWGYLFYQSHFTNIHLGDEAKYALLLANDSLQAVKKGIDVVNGYNYVHCGPMIFNGKNSYYVSQFFNDTIYEVPKNEDPKICAKYILDYSTNKATNDENLQMSEKFYNAMCVIENANTQLFKFWSPLKGMCYVIRDKETGKSIGGRWKSIDWEFLPEFLFGVMTVKDDYFVSWIQPYKGMHYKSPAVSETENQKIAELGDEDNYVLVFFKFKEIK